MHQKIRYYHCFKRCKQGIWIQAGFKFVVFVKNRFNVRFILKTDDDYGTRVEKLNLFSLQYRRFLFDVLLFFFKVLNGYINIDISAFINFYSDYDRYCLRDRDNCVLKKNYARTDNFKFSFFNRIVDMWNALPLSSRRASSIYSFKKGVFDYLATW